MDVRNNEAHRRYEIVVDGHLAFAEYRRTGGVVTFTHTFVPEALAGQGIASRLIGFALADVRARGLKLVAKCPFVRGYIDRHPEARDLLA